KGACTTSSGSEAKPKGRRGGLWTPIFSGRPRRIEIRLPAALDRFSDRQHSRTGLIEHSVTILERLCVIVMHDLDLAFRSFERRGMLLSHSTLCNLDGRLLR